MTWVNPLAWFGLAALAVPLLIHLLGRRRARDLPFPTLRFLEASRLQPVRRTRIQDLALLALRLLVLAVAVSALAQPVLRTDARDAAAARLLSRVVVVDTSASMVRDAIDPALAGAQPGDAIAKDVARREAERLVAGATAGVIVETAFPASALAGAAAWLGTQPGPGEIVVVSDFQAGTLGPADIARVPVGPRIRLHRIAISTGGPVSTSSATGDRLTVADMRLLDDSMSVEWSVRPFGAPPLRPRLFAAPGDTAAVSAAFDAARSMTTGFGFDAARPVAVVWPGHDGQDALRRSARPIDVPWMAAMTRRIARDPLLRGAGDAADSERPAGPVEQEDLVRIGGPHAIAGAAAATIDGVDNLVLFASVPPGSLESTALLAAAGRAAIHRPPVSELEPDVLSDSVLGSLEREAVERAAATDATQGSDARWFWLAVLALIGIETLVRRRMDRRPRVPGGEAVA